MTVLPLAVALLGLAAIVAFVAAPLVRRGSQGSAPADENLPVLERRDRALAALRELEFDHRTGKITDADYRALLGRLRTEAAEALQAVGPAEGAG
ncbi:MAG TPA: hypothetical protein VFU30_15045 [Gaiellaceae bacterium]|nr:hypothetical protein [Gaiellaceae bacterium]